MARTSRAMTEKERSFFIRRLILIRMGPSPPMTQHQRPSPSSFKSVPTMLILRPPPPQGQDHPDPPPALDRLSAPCPTLSRGSGAAIDQPGGKQGLENRAAPDRLDQGRHAWIPDLHVVRQAMAAIEHERDAAAEKNISHILRIVGAKSDIQHRR